MRNANQDLRTGGIPESVKGFYTEKPNELTIYSDIPMELAVATCKLLNTGQFDFRAGGKTTVILTDLR